MSGRAQLGHLVSGSVGGGNPGLHWKESVYLNLGVFPVCWEFGWLCLLPYAVFLVTKYSVFLAALGDKIVRDIRPGAAFEPTYIYRLLTVIKSSLSEKVWGALW